MSQGMLHNLGSAVEQAEQSLVDLENVLHVELHFKQPWVDCMCEGTVAARDAPMAKVMNDEKPKQSHVPAPHQVSVFFVQECRVRLK